MSCCTRAHLPKKYTEYYAKRSDSSSAPAGNGPIVGTWDFKWPEDTEIRVAFQRPPSISNNDFATVKQIIAELAERWHAGQSKLRFAFDVPDFGPPESAHPQQRSKVANEQWRLYDVLVSLEPLPLTRSDTIASKSERIFLPQSEIGSYARRIDFGNPTMFLGRLPAKDNQPEPTWREYYSSDIAQTMVVHEFGHALGLAHEHQSPVARRKFGWTENSYDFTKARDILVNRFGVPAAELPLNDPKTDDFLQGHLGAPWPGNERFSDWRSYATGQLDSIMAVPYHACALSGSNHTNCGPNCSQIQLSGQPSQADFDAINAMYS